MNTNVQSLVDEYVAGVATLSEREMAVREESIWESALAAGMAKGSERTQWLKTMLGGTSPGYIHRHKMLSFGTMAEQLWGRVERREMLLHTAAGIVSEARKIVAERHVPVTDAIETALGEYDARPFVRFVDGRPVRSRAVGVKAAPPSPEHKDAPPRAAHANGDTVTQVFWSSMRDQIAGYIRDRLADEDPIVAHAAVERFMLELRALIEDHQAFISASRRATSQRRAVGQDTMRKRLVAAMHVLHMDPPARNHKVNFREAQRQKRRLLGLYHPDKNKGSEHHRPAFDAVMEAFRVVEQWVQMYESQSTNTA
jgi:hypothetical protein